MSVKDLFKKFTAPPQLIPLPYTSEDLSYDEDEEFCLEQIHDDPNCLIALCGADLDGGAFVPTHEIPEQNICPDCLRVYKARP